MIVEKFQEGGAMPAEAPMPAEQAPAAEPAAAQDAANAEQEAIATLQQMAMTIAQQLQDPGAIQALGEMLIQIAQQGAAPQQPTFQRKGGRLTRI